GTVARLPDRRPPFFFFQAEDGIRCRTVTGVQTCALPIFVLPARREQSRVESKPNPPLAASIARAHDSSPPQAQAKVRPTKCKCRSEERRVGKECKTLWVARQ